MTELAVEELIYDESRAWEEARLVTEAPTPFKEMHISEADAARRATAKPWTDEAVIFEKMVNFTDKGKLPDNVLQLIEHSLYRQAFYMLREVLEEGRLPGLTKAALGVALDALGVTYSPKMKKAELVELATKKVKAIQEAQGQAREFQS